MTMMELGGCFVYNVVKRSCEFVSIDKKELEQDCQFSFSVLCLQ